MAVAAIDAKLIGVDGMWEINRLDWLITGAGVFGREIVCHAKRGNGPDQRRAQDDLQRQLIGPFWKNIRHGSANGGSGRDSAEKKRSGD